MQPDILPSPLCSVLQIDPLSMRALHIFQTDSQPSLMGIGSNKEGFSVFSLMDRTVTSLVCVLPVDCTWP